MCSRRKLGRAVGDETRRVVPTRTRSHGNPANECRQLRGVRLKCICGGTPEWGCFWGGRLTKLIAATTRPSDVAWLGRSEADRPAKHRCGWARADSPCRKLYRWEFPFIGRAAGSGNSAVYVVYGGIARHSRNKLVRLERRCSFLPLAVSTFMSHWFCGLIFTSVLRAQASAELNWWIVGIFHWPWKGWFQKLCYAVQNSASAAVIRVGINAFLHECKF